MAFNVSISKQIQNIVVHITKIFVGTHENNVSEETMSSIIKAICIS
jgi:hypothetical protein